MKDFIDNFYSYDFTGILCNDESSDDSDTEIDVVGDDDDDEEEADKTKPVSPAVDKEIRNPLYIDTAGNSLYCYR